MYLLIFEDGNFKMTDQVHDEDLICVDAGILDVICMKTNTQYFGGDWVELEILTTL